MLRALVPNVETLVYYRMSLRDKDLPGFAGVLGDQILAALGIQDRPRLRQPQTTRRFRRPFARQQLLPHRAYPTETDPRRLRQFRHLPRTQWPLQQDP